MILRAKTICFLFLLPVVLASRTMQVSGETILNFPHVVNYSNERTGFAIVNHSSSAALLTFRAYNEQGLLIAGPGITNPATQILPGGGQLAKLAFEIFGPGFIADSAWAQVESSNPNVTAFFMFFDDLLNFLDGADVKVQSPISLTSVFIHHPAMEVYLANPNAGSAKVSLELRSDAGQLISSRTTQISPMGRISGDLAALFPSLTLEILGQPAQQVKAGSIWVTSDCALTGFSLMGQKSRSIYALNGQTTLDAGTQLFAPQYVENANYSSELSIINMDASVTASVSLALLGKDGKLIGNSIQRFIPARGKIVIDDPAVFGLPRGGNPIESYVAVTSNDPRLIGSIVFGDPLRTAFATALPLVSRPQREILYSQAVQDDLFFTGAAIVNPSEMASSLVVEVYNSLGQRIRFGEKTLPPRGRDTFVLAELFPGLRMNAGYFRVRATQDVASFAIFGTHKLSALSAIPPQSTISDAGTTTTTTTSTTLAVSTSITSTTRPPSTSTSTITVPTTAVSTSTTTTTNTTATTTTRPSTTSTTMATAPTTATSTTTTTTISTTTTLPASIARGALDSPTNGQTVSGIVNGLGWAFIQSGNSGVLPSRIDMLIDGTVAAQATTGLTRTDVRDYFASQGVTVPANTGFSFTWNSTAVANGSHTLSIRALDAGGSSNEAAFEIARINIIVAQPPSLCNIFSEDFANPNLVAAGWTVIGGSWQVVQGKLQVGNLVNPNVAASAFHPVPVPDLFKLTVDVESDATNVWDFGIALATTTPFTVPTNQGMMTVLGIGVEILPSGQAGFFYAPSSGGLIRPFPMVSTGPVRNFGLQWTAGGLSLLVNGVSLQTLTPTQLGVTTPTAHKLNLLALLAIPTRPDATMRFDNVCMGIPN